MFVVLAGIGVAAEGGSMAAKSAGILIHRRRAGAIEVLLVHPGGPFWARRDAGAWSIPKGEYADSEDPEAAARREFQEETGWTIEGGLVPLGEIRQKAGKAVTAFAAEGDFDPASLESNRFEMEWPPKSGKRASFPEIDSAGWFSLAEASEKMIEGQRPLLERLEALIGRSE
jgi:predicted NUDIX family NTP pyrophosphohydrolase